MSSRQVDVAIIDYRISNLFSVQAACKYVGLVSKVTNDTDIILNAKSVILPGVGAFPRAMGNLKDLELLTVIDEFIQSGKPFMGICLGFQLLFSESMEFGKSKGLSIFKGKIKKLSNLDKDNKKIKVPHVSWSKIKIKKGGNKGSWSTSPFESIKNGEHMYFVHSFFADSIKNELISSTTDYGGVTFCSSIYHKNVFACQFHPEKSAGEGIKIYDNLYRTLNK